MDKKGYEEVYERKKRKLLENPEEMQSKRLLRRLRDQQLLCDLECKDKRFRGGTNLVDAIDDWKTSLTLSLFQDGFSLNIDDESIFPYDNSTKDFLDAIDTGRLTTDIIELIQEKNCHFYDGCILVELQDFRTSEEEGKPLCRKTILKPDMCTILRDIQLLCSKTFPDVIPEDTLEFERRILPIIQEKICLDPTEDVARFANSFYTSEKKFHIKPKSSRISTYTDFAKPPSLLHHLKQGGEKNIFKAYSHKPFATTVWEMINQLLNEQQYKADSSETQSQTKNTTVTNPKDINISDTTNPANPANRKIRFEGNQGKIFCDFQVYQNRAGGFEGTLRVGNNPDTGVNGDIIRFPLGNSRTSSLFIDELKSLSETDSCLGVITSDSNGSVAPTSATTAAAKPRVRIMETSAPQQPIRPKEGPNLTMLNEQTKKKMAQKFELKTLPHISQKVPLTKQTTSTILPSPSAPYVQPGKVFQPVQLHHGTSNIQKPQVPQAKTNQATQPQKPLYNWLQNNNAK